jgi:hypothetical protein
MEYLIITIFIVGVFVLTSYLKTKYVKERKWKNLVLDSSALVLMGLVFAFGLKNNTPASLSNFKIFLITLTLLYFGYRIYKDLKLLRSK